MNAVPELQMVAKGKVSREGSRTQLKADCMSLVLALCEWEAEGWAEVTLRSMLSPEVVSP